MGRGNATGWVKTAFTFIVGIAAIVATLVFIGGVGFGKDEFLVETYYDNPVSGLSVGSDVNFRGVKVGEVRKIGFVGAEYEEAEGDDCQKIYVLMALKTKNLALRPGGTAEEAVLPLIEKGLRATVVASGITGISKIELNFPVAAVAPEPVAWTPANPYIPPSLSMFENLSLSASRMLHQLNKTDFGTVWSNIATVAESSAALVSGVRETVEDERARVSRLLDGIERTADEIGAFVRELRDNPSSLVRGIEREPLPETRR